MFHHQVLNALKVFKSQCIPYNGQHTLLQHNQHYGKRSTVNIDFWLIVGFFHPRSISPNHVACWTGNLICRLTFWIWCFWKLYKFWTHLQRSCIYQSYRYRWVWRVIWFIAVYIFLVRCSLNRFENSLPVWPI